MAQSRTTRDRRDDAQGAAGAAAQHPWVKNLARVGHAAIGVVYMLVGGLAVRLALGPGGGGGGAPDAALQRSEARLRLLAAQLSAIVWTTDAALRVTSVKRLEELERLRAAFVASISHDLNTPLTAIKAGLGLLEDTAEAQLRADQFRLVRNARRNGERLKRLIDDLLTYSRLSAGAPPLQREAVDLREVAADARAAVHALAEHKGQRLALDLPWCGHDLPDGPPPGRGS